MKFALCASYTRQAIHDRVGGNLQTFLPELNGKIVAACLTPELNPDAPHVILVGGGPDIYRRGEMLSRQSDPVPVFLKFGADDWRYAGDHEVSASSADISDVHHWQSRAGRTDVLLVVTLRRVPFQPHYIGEWMP